VPDDRSIETKPDDSSPQAFVVAFFAVAATVRCGDDKAQTALAGVPDTSARDMRAAGECRPLTLRRFIPS
jgi:hypothetical protein